MDDADGCQCFVKMGPEFPTFMMIAQSYKESAKSGNGSIIKIASFAAL